MKAVQDGDLELARYYIYEGVDVNYEHPEMMTTLLIESVQAGREEMTALLLKHGANPRQRAGFGQKTALETAKAGKQENILRLLEAHAGPASSGLRFWQRWLAYLWH